MSARNKGKQVFANVVKKFGPAARILIPLAAIAYLTYSLGRLPRESVSIWFYSLEPGFTSLLNGFLIVGLSITGWWFEAVKWRMLAGKLQPLGMLRAFAGVLYGVSLGMITPKRSGEFAGRIMVLNPENRVRGLAINTVAAMTQLMATLFAGMATLVYLFVYGSGVYDRMPGKLESWAFPLIILLILFMVLVFIRPLIRYLLGRSFFPSWLRAIDALLLAGNMDWVRLLVISFIRYGIFLWQFYLLQQLFGLGLNPVDSSLLLALIYLVMTAVPLSALGEAGVRASVALLCYNMLFGGSAAAQPVYEAPLAASILGLWMVNLALPALAGALIGWKIIK